MLLLDDVRINLGYKMLDRLGSGRQGVVLEVHRRAHPDCVTRHALKIFDPGIYPSLAEYDDDMCRIARQVGVLQRLFHPNLVQCNWVSSVEGVYMLMMEMIEGLNLYQMMTLDQHAKLESEVSAQTWATINDRVFSTTGYHLQPGIAFYILRKVLRGLELMHRCGYIHCDVKPSNIMLDRFGTVKLIDFGRAVSIENPTGIFLGSLMYMAPELHRREPLTPVADLYSAGLVTLELLYGDHLVNPQSDEDTIYEFKLQLPQRIDEFLPEDVGTNSIMATILRRLLAVEPEHRYSDASEADYGADGVRMLHRQLVAASLDVDYGRELENYLFQRLSHVEKTATQ
jgi:serine/threonine protein kinase